MTAIAAGTIGGVTPRHGAAAVCPICRTPTALDELAEAGWVDGATAERLATRRPEWQRSDGACAACVQDALLSLLREKGDRVLSRVIQDVWPLDAEAAFGALPTPIRMRADPRFTGRGVTIAMVDGGFYPHVDLVRPTNRIRAVADTGSTRIRVTRFGPDDAPAWTAWDAPDDSRWHGLMTTAAAAGNGFASRGLYRGLASDADLVLVRARDPRGRITSESIARALAWLFDTREELGVGVVSVSLGGDATAMLESSPVDGAVARLVEAGVVVVVAAGNAGTRDIVPPATAPDAITVGGLDDRNVFDAAERALWHSSFGMTWMGDGKPELVAPSIWVAAPVLPVTAVAREAAELFARRAAGDATCEPRIAELKLITPYYQHVEGTSFAAPIVAGIVACMLEAASRLTPRRVRELLTLACRPVSGAPHERQGAGAVDAGCAVALAIAHADGVAYPAVSNLMAGEQPRFVLHDADATDVRVLGNWDGWASPGKPAARLAPGLWVATLPALSSGTYAYKFSVGGNWRDDATNRRREPDGFGGTNSTFAVR